MCFHFQLLDLVFRFDLKTLFVLLPDPGIQDAKLSSELFGKMLFSFPEGRELASILCVFRRCLCRSS